VRKDFGGVNGTPETPLGRLQNERRTNGGYVARKRSNPMPKELRVGYGLGRLLTENLSTETHQDGPKKERPI